MLFLKTIGPTLNSLTKMTNLECSENDLAFLNCAQSSIYLISEVLEPFKGDKTCI